MTRASDRSLTAILLASYAVVLLLSLSVTPLWLDEIQQLASTHHNTMAELIRWVKLDVGASPLPYLTQRAVLDALGYSVFAVRLSAAVCSVLCGLVFAALCPYFVTKGRVLAVAMFVVLPLEFRYGIEGRVYSQAMLMSLLTLWLFLQMMERPSFGIAALYCLSAAVGMYSQPLICLSIFAQATYALTLPDHRLRYWSWATAGIAGLAYLPWWLQKLQVQKEMHGVVYFFSLRQITPKILLHELTGGGYLSSILLLMLVFWPLRAASKQAGVEKQPYRGLLISTFLFTSVCPILIDAAVPYYFAARQLLFSMPALVLLAAQGIERMGRTSAAQRAAAFAIPGLFLAAGVIKDFQQATVPRDDLDRTAQAVVQRLPVDGCILAAPVEQSTYYTFLRPQLEGRVCGRDLASSAAVLTVASPYSGAEVRRSMRQSIPSNYVAGAPVKIGQSELTLFRRP